MAYTINRTDGTIVTTITDGTSDNTTSLTLFGKSFSGFGEGLNENLIKLLENSSSTSAPTAPLKGELWFDNNTNNLKVYNGTAFEPTGGSTSQSTAPTSPSAGDLWHDSDVDQLFVYTGSAFQLVGPVFTSSQTLSGWQIETLGSSGGDKVVSSMYVGNTRVAILSKETFTPSVSQSGFSEIKAGFTLNSTLGAVFEGTNTQASNIDVSGTTNTSATIIAGGNFLRADAADTTTGALTVDTDSGVIIGDAQELTITVSSNDVTVAQTSQDKDLKFTVNDGGVTKTPLQLTGADGGVDIVGDVTITGNLNVSGEYENTAGEINLLNDAFLKLNNGGGETDSGIIVETSDTDDARLFYETGTNRWMAGDGGNYSQLIRDADATTNGATSQGSVLKTDSSGIFTVAGVELSAVGSAITTSDGSDTSVPSIGQIVAFGTKWGGSEKTVSTSDPSGGNDGDFWFKYSA